MTLRHPPESSPGHMVDDEDDTLYITSSTRWFALAGQLQHSAPGLTDEVDLTGASVYVKAEDFMAVQKERDELRRAMAFVNGLRTELHFLVLRPSLDVVASRLAQICEVMAGMTVEEGRAHNELIQQVREGRL